MVVKKQSIQGEGKTEARADTSTPTVAHAEHLEFEPTSYVYVGGLNEVVVVIDGTGYDFRKSDPVHLAHPVPTLDQNPDFERWEEAK